MPNTFRSSFRPATTAAFTAGSSRRGWTLARRFGLAGLCVMALAACSDATTAPGSVDRVDAAYLLPAVTDARLRLTPTVASIPVRQQVILGLADLEFALRSGDGQLSRAQLLRVTSVLTEYRAQSLNSSSADISAIFLVLDAVSQVVGAGNSGS